MEHERKKVLIVDDELDNYDVVFTDKGKEAFGLARDIAPDVIILDVLLPDMMGPHIQQKLSQDEETKHIPVILLSGLNTKEDEAIIKKCGIRRILAKPTTAQQILQAVREAIVEF